MIYWLLMHFISNVQKYVLQMSFIISFIHYTIYY